jgi:tRNA pseudouridine32 synthase/23S rRNA pseudouridine746 synthase
VTPGSAEPVELDAEVGDGCGSLVAGALSEHAASAAEAARADMNTTLVRIVVVLINLVRIVIVRFVMGAVSVALPVTSLGYSILFADSAIVACDKASGLLSVPGIGPEKADCLVARLQVDYPGARIVHRLDRDTSGVIVLARDAVSHRTLSMAFEAREVEKEYEALVAGHVARDRGEVDLPLRKEALGSARQIVHHEEGKPSFTAYEVLERGRDADGFAWTRVRLLPRTGRSHQLRVHMLAIGHPILGDDLYAEGAARTARTRLCLHACMLSFAHPVTGAAMRITAPAQFA